VQSYLNDFEPEKSTLVERTAVELFEAVITADHGQPVTRTSFAELTGVSAPSVSRAARLLIKAGFLRAGRELPTQGAGRPEVVLDVDTSKYVLGLSIIDGITGEITAETRQISNAARFSCAAVRLDGSYWAIVDSQPAPAGIDALILALAKLITYAVNRQPPEFKMLGIGLMVGGQISGGSILNSPNLGIQSPYDFTGKLREACSLPNAVYLMIENDANAVARRMTWFDAVEGEDSFALVLLKEDGIGCGIAENGRVKEGPTGRSGELGHIPIALTDKPECRCGNKGCLETVASLTSMAQHLEEFGSAEDALKRLYARIADLADDNAQKELRAAAQYFGEAIGTLINIADPGLIVVLAPDAMLDHPHWQGNVRKSAMDCVVGTSTRPGPDIRFARLPSDAEYAAAGATQVIEQIIRNPLLNAKKQAPMVGDV